MRLADLIFQGRGVLKAENDAGFPFGFCAPDVGRGAHRGDQVGVVGKPALPLRNIAHRADEPLPDRACAIRGGHPPRRMSANTARLHFEMTRPSMTVSESCRRVMLPSRSSFANDAQVGRPNLCRPSAAIDLFKVT